MTGPVPYLKRHVAHDGGPKFVWHYHCHRLHCGCDWEDKDARGICRWTNEDGECAHWMAQVQELRALAQTAIDEADKLEADL